jgi:uncharacterized protein YndB with AHSA1/START domain
VTESPYDIEISLVLPAPPDRVFDAFTVPDQFARWYGPPGFPVARDTVELEARVGGPQRFTMVSEVDPGCDPASTEYSPRSSRTRCWRVTVPGTGYPVRPGPGNPTFASS